MQIRDVPGALIREARDTRDKGRGWRRCGEWYTCVAVNHTAHEMESSRTMAAVDIEIMYRSCDGRKSSRTWQLNLFCKGRSGNAVRVISRLG